MNLKALTQNDLFAQTKTAIHEEYLATIKVLRYFREIERRKDYLGYKSLYEFLPEQIEP